MIKKDNPKNIGFLEIILNKSISLLPQNTCWPYQEQEDEDNIVGNQ